MRIAIIGAGSWGTAVAGIAAQNTDAVLWARRPALADAINARHENADYLPGLVLPPSLRATSSLEEACTGADAVVMGVPSHGFRDVIGAAAPSIAADAAVLSLSKGIEQHTLARMTEVIADVLDDHPVERIGVLSGPNLAKEIVQGQPAATVIAMTDDAMAERLQTAFMTPTFRVYTNPDVVGCEIAGALKNVIAIGVGIAHGLDYGDNAKAALITRGLAELARLGVAMGGDPLTFAGLAGMGDLIATCNSPQSRNRTVGVELGKGRKLDEIVADMKMVAEGVKSTEAVTQLGARFGVELPVADFVGRVLYSGAHPADLVPELMLRKAKSELHGMR
ncbi:MAG TPA: NAD(P)H-dependent glycerol-3-phosphate dehydrogenase [Acidimicrobiia bacterium]